MYGNLLPYLLHCLSRCRICGRGKSILILHLLRKRKKKKPPHAVITFTFDSSIFFTFCSSLSRRLSLLALQAHLKKLMCVFSLTQGPDTKLSEAEWHIHPSISKMALGCRVSFFFPLPETFNACTFNMSLTADVTQH